MSRLPTITGEFVVGSDPELRFTPGGQAVCNVSVKATESKKTDTGWEDGDSTPWINVTLWKEAAELAAEHITTGTRVLVTGVLYARTYEKRDGTQGQAIEVKYATVAPVLRAPKAAQRSAGYADDPWTTPRTDGTTQHHVPDDPWATSPPTEPPF